jgi:spoIIIJ-associated protein
MREVERSAPSVEEAVEAALEELGVSEQEASVQIVQEPRQGVLGLGAHEAIVKVSVPDDVAAGGAVAEEQAEIAADFLEGLLDRMGVGAEVDYEVADGVMYVDIFGAQDDEAMGLLIGRHGQALEALQEIVRSAVQRRTEERCRVMVDVEDYRKRRRSQLAGKARETAQRVRKTGRQERLEPMSSYERKIVHDAAGEVSGIETASEGEEPTRRVVIRRKR